MIPRLSSRENSVRVELREIIRLLALQIEPASTPILDRGQKLNIEVNDVFAYLDPERTRSHGHSLSFTRDSRLFVELHPKDSFPQDPMRVNAQKAFTENNKAGNMLDSIGRKIMKLNPVDVKQSQEERVKRERKATREMVGKNDSLNAIRAWNLLVLRRLAETIRGLGDLTFLLKQDEGLLRDVGALLVSRPFSCCYRSTGGCSSACSGSSLLPSSHGYSQGIAGAQGRR